MKKRGNYSAEQLVGKLPSVRQDAMLDGFQRSKNKTVIRSQYQKHERVQVQADFELMTKQEFKDECDVNNIVAKHKATGTITHLNSNTAQFGDFSNVMDYQSAAQAIISANDAFERLPAKVRKNFSNNPAEFLEAMEKGDIDELVRQGVFKKKPEPIQPEPLAPANPKVDPAAK